MNQLRRLPIQQLRLTRQTLPSKSLKKSRKLQRRRQQLLKLRSRTRTLKTGRTLSMISLKQLLVRLNVKIYQLPQQRAKSSHLMRRKRRRKNQARSRETQAVAVKSRRNKTTVRPKATQRLKMLRVVMQLQLAVPVSSSCSS